MSQAYLNDDGGLRVWFRDEIRNALLSAYATTTAMAASQQSPEATAFRRGFISALVAVGLNFGIAPLPFTDDDRRMRGGDTLGWASGIAERELGP